MIFKFNKHIKSLHGDFNEDFLLDLFKSSKKGLIMVQHGSSTAFNIGRTKEPHSADNSSGNWKTSKNIEN